MAAAILGVSGAAFTEPQANQSWKNVTVTIHRLAATDNLDGDVLADNDADFYARVSIAGFRTETKVVAKDDARPNWIIRESATGTMVPIVISVYDDDGHLEDKDDHVDINPRERVKDLTLWLNTTTGAITGDVTGQAGQQLMTRGGGKDSDKARIWFSVSYS